MKFLSGYNLKIFIFWWEDEGGGGKWASFGLVEGLSSNPRPPCSIAPVVKTVKVESKIWKKIKRENGLSQNKFI